jgi:hypothetical protein
VRGGWHPRADFRTDFEREDRWCCEFGAWDGRKYSNTYQLIANKGWSGVLIEADPVKFEDLKRTYIGNRKVVLLNRFVEYA